MYFGHTLILIFQGSQDLASAANGDGSRLQGFSCSSLEVVTFPLKMPPYSEEERCLALAILLDNG